MSYTETLSVKIADVVENYNTTESYETRVNTFLDSVIEYQNSITSLTNSVSDLSEFIIENNNSVSVDEFLSIKPNLDEIINVLNKFYIAARKGKTYTCTKTQIKEFHYALNDLKEAENDFITFRIKLDQDPEFNRLMNITFD